MTELVAALTEVTEEQKAQIIASERTTKRHGDFLTALPAMRQLEIGGRGSRSLLPVSFSVAAWNLERCLFPQRSARHLMGRHPEVILLSEMDKGMARTGQQNTIAKMAEALDMHYAFGVEFFEMGLGGPTERAFCSDDTNQQGWHGNGILSSVPFEKLALIRLDEKGHWFSLDANPDADPDQPRIGGRMAVAALLLTEMGPLCVVSTHLESNTGAAHRLAQFGQLLDAVDAFAPDVPVIIGGDLNTGNHMPPDYDWRGESLFDLGRERGYHWELTAQGMTTRNSLITPHPKRRMKLDWFAARNVRGNALSLLEAIDSEGPLSDHECILCQVSL